MFIGLPEDLHVDRSIDVPCPSDYYHLCCKSMEGLARLYQAYPNADWYYKVCCRHSPCHCTSVIASSSPHQLSYCGVSRHHSAPSYRAVIVSLLRQHCTIIASTVPSLRQHCAIIASSLHHHCIEVLSRIPIINT
jgi:hypothetical protein